MKMTILCFLIILFELVKSFNDSMIENMKKKSKVIACMTLSRARMANDVVKF